MITNKNIDSIANRCAGYDELEMAEFQKRLDDQYEINDDFLESNQDETQPGHIAK